MNAWYDARICSSVGGELTPPFILKQGRILLSLFCDNFSLTALVPVILANKFRQVSEKFGENSFFAKLLRQIWRNLFAKMTGICENDDVLSNQKIPYRESENDLPIEMAESQRVLYWPIKTKHVVLRK